MIIASITSHLNKAFQFYQCSLTMKVVELYQCLMTLCWCHLATILCSQSELLMILKRYKLIIIPNLKKRWKVILSHCRSLKYGLVTYQRVLCKTQLLKVWVYLLPNNWNSLKETALMLNQIFPKFKKSSILGLTHWTLTLTLEQTQSSWFLFISHYSNYQRLCFNQMCSLSPECIISKCLKHLRQFQICTKNLLLTSNCSISTMECLILIMKLTSCSILILKKLKMKNKEMKLIAITKLYLVMYLRWVSLLSLKTREVLSS